ncbi:hypothetical protein vBSdyM006_017 [Shigella phage vB_SdyM_006]|nr:hypothetical protein vBSdyM006_017 [Shigella phage vB_SdyM_006]
MSEFNIGDKVLLAPGSQYFGKSDHNPSDVKGIVIELYPQIDEDTHFIKVQWDSGYTNTYRGEDLVSAKNIEPKILYTIGFFGDPKNGTFASLHTANLELEKLTYKEPKLKVSYKQHIPGYKSVNYLGVELLVKDDHYYIATDEDGDIYSFMHKPTYDEDDGIWSDECGDIEVELLIRAEVIENPKNSLVEL